MLAHFAGDMGEDFMVVVQLHSKQSAGQDRGNGSLEFNGLFAAHPDFGGGLRGGLEMAGRYDANVRNPARIPHAFDLRN